VLPFARLACRLLLETGRTGSATRCEATERRLSPSGWNTYLLVSERAFQAIDVGTASRVPFV
jgi:hypothetical protein